MDELQELRRANPVQVEQVADVVSVDRALVVEALTDDPHVPNLRSRAGVPTGLRPSRLLGGAAAAALAFVAGVAVVDRINDTAPVEMTVAAPYDATTSINASTDWAFDRDVDILAVHLDWADRSDAHVAAASREVAVWFDIEPIVVVIARSSDNSTAVADVMNATWASAWLDVEREPTAARAASLTRWLAAIDAGGRVFIAEGSDGSFSADLVRELQRLRPEVDTSTSVRLLHTPDSAFERGALATFLTQEISVKQLQPERTDGLSRSAGAAFETSIVDGRHEQEWSAALDYLSVEQLDLTETALILEVLNVGSNQVADPDDFAAFFVGDQPDMGLRDGS